MLSSETGLPFSVYAWLSDVPTPKWKPCVYVCHQTFCPWEVIEIDGYLGCPDLSLNISFFLECFHVSLSLLTITLFQPGILSYLFCTNMGIVRGIQYQKPAARENLAELGQGFFQLSLLSIMFLSYT